MSSFTTSTYTPDRLIADETPLKTITVTLLSGENRPRGAVLGKVTASSKFKLSASAAADGSQTASVILAEACDATSGDKKATAYVAGGFNEKALTFGAGHTADSVRDALRDAGIHLKTPVSA